MNEYNKPILSMFAANYQQGLIAMKLPKLSHCDLIASDQQYASRLRLVDFNQSYSLTSNVTLS